MKFLNNLRLSQPLRFVLLIALAARMLSVVFSPGYLMIDDHFLVIEAAGSWIDGEDYNNWLPWNKNEGDIPSVVNFAYVGSQYIVLSTLKSLGFDDPKNMMFVVRLLHALYSLLIVYFGYRIAEYLSDKKTAFTVGMLLALFAFMPNFSVRNLVEMVCVPPLMWSTYVLLKGARNLKTALIAGIGIGIATGIRYQCGIYGIGIGLVLLFLKDWLRAVGTGLSAIFAFFLMQLPDVFLCGEPFVQLRTYIDYNSTHAGDYPEGPWYQYGLTIIGFLLPPFSLALIFGSILAVRKYALLIVPSFLFLIFHSIYPNKQERFIIPVLIFMIVAGTICWEMWQQKSTWWQNREKLSRRLWNTFWILNMMAFAVVSLSYVKKSRVEAMYYLYNQPEYNNFLAVYVDSAAQPPQFYSGKWEHYYWFVPGETKLEIQHDDICERLSYQDFPNYVLFYGANVTSIVDKFKTEYSSLSFQTTIQPGYFDRLLNYLNPKNTLETVHIYSIDQQIECPQQ